MFASLFSPKKDTDQEQTETEQDDTTKRMRMEAPVVTPQNKVKDAVRNIDQSLSTGPKTRAAEGENVAQVTPALGYRIEESMMAYRPQIMGHLKGSELQERVRARNVRGKFLSEHKGNIECFAAMMMAAEVEGSVTTEDVFFLMERKVWTEASWFTSLRQETDTEKLMKANKIALEESGSNDLAEGDDPVFVDANAEQEVDDIEEVEDEGEDDLVLIGQSKPEEPKAAAPDQQEPPQTLSRRRKLSQEGPIPAGYGGRYGGCGFAEDC